MKKSMRLFLTGSVQAMFFKQFIKENADKLGVKGFIRTLEDKRIEIFLEGHQEAIDRMVPLCERGPKHSVIRNVEQKEEKYQGFKDFKIISF